ncbi:MAG: hypothetical protein IAE83_01635 [Anaerolinea sp.]|nr:hypothetical protein [Anaerolinea sp.]
MTTPSSRPNFFVLLELDPNSAWSDAAFEKALLDKRKHWTGARTSHPDVIKKNEAAQYLGMETEIRAVMSDPAQRESERKAADSILKKTREEQKDRFDSKLQSVLIKGHITESELTNLLNTTDGKALFPSSDALRKYLVSKKAKIQADDNGEDKKPIPIDAAIFNQTQKLLDAVGKRDLYDFLGLGRNPTDQQVKDETARLDREAGLNREALSVQQTIKDLAGLAATWMLTSNRPRYDEALRQKKFEDVDMRIKELAQIQDKRVFKEQTLDIIKGAKRLKREEVVDHLRGLARNQGIVIEGLESGFTDMHEALQSQILCPNCDTYNDPKNQKCTKCALTLSIQCPQCQTKNRVDHVFCSNCACDLSVLPALERLIQEARKWIKDRQYETALSFLKRVEAQSADIPKSSVAVETKKLLLDTKSKHQEQTTAQKAIKDAIAERKFYAARSLLKVFESDHVPLDDKDIAAALKTERELIDAAIDAAEKLVAQALWFLREGNPDSPEKAAKEYQDALEKCTDCDAAKQGLAKIPPVPPRDLVGKAIKKGVELAWKPSPTLNVRYTLFRKERRPPDPDKDKPLGVIETSPHTDSSAPHGIPVYYAVYTDLEGVLSLTGAVLAQPLLLTAEVHNLHAVPGDKSVTLTWEPPPHVIKITITRSTLNQPGSTQRVHTASATDAAWTDIQVENDRTYQYTVTAVFKDHDLKDKSSQGAQVSVTPEPALQPVRDLRLTPTGNMVKLEWTKPPRGEVCILGSSAKPTLKPVISRDELKQYGAILSVKSDLDRTFDPIQPGKTYYTVITLSRTSAYVGNTIEYFAVEEVENLRCRVEHDRIRLFWDFPSGCEKARVIYTEIVFEGRKTVPQNDGWFEITPQQYDEEGGGFIRLSGHVDQYQIGVRAGYKDNDEIHFSPGETLTVEVRPSVEISYSFRWRSRWFRRAPRLLLKVKTRRGETKYILPQLFLECRQGEQTNLIQRIEIDDVGLVSKPIKPIVVHLNPQMRPCYLILRTSDLDKVRITHPLEHKALFR